MDIKELVESVPDFTNFPTLEEMDASTARLEVEFPDLVRRTPLGHTTEGRPLELLTIVGGARAALVVGAPHPNEPIGCRLIEFLSRKICEDAAFRNALGYTWHFVKAIDADGVKLNENWFNGPFTITNYARNFYRPPPAEQAEWSFPVSYKTLRFDQPSCETRAFMRAIDIVEPDFLFSLHNSNFSGVFYFLPRRADALYPSLKELPKRFGLPLQLSVPELPFIDRLDDGIFRFPFIEEIYEQLASSGIEDPATVWDFGASSGDYSYRGGRRLFDITAEIPYWDHPDVCDISRTDTSRSEAIFQKAHASEERLATMDTILAPAKPVLKLETRLHSAVFNGLKTRRHGNNSELSWARTSAAANEFATKSELFLHGTANDLNYLTDLGMIVRMLELELAVGVHPSVSRALDLARALFDEEAATFERSVAYRVLPIRSLVAIQLGAGLAAARYAASEASS